jgi:alanine dehydrogenase
MDTLWLGDREVRQLLSMGEALDAVEEAFRQHALGKVQMPPKLYLTFHKHGGDLRAMPAYLEEMDAAGVKIVNAHPSNPSRGLPTVMAVLVLNDPATGAPQAIMDATYLTDMRTGAAGGVASKHLARKDSRVLGIIGAGRQARTQLLAITEVMDIEMVKVASRSMDDAARFIDAMGPRVDVEMEACTVRDACNCDVLSTTTPVRKPVVREEWIREGTHINAIGADAEGKQELDPGILKKARIFVDDMAQATHSGEVNVPLARGLLSLDDIDGEIGEVIAGVINGRTDEREITIFDSTGLAIQDVATGLVVYNKAVKEGVGRKLTLF